MTEIVEIVAPPETVVIEADGVEQVLLVESPPAIEVIEIAEQGPPGPPGRGDKGDRGEPGLAGVSLVHTQAEPAARWSIAHDLNRYPSVTVIDSAGGEVEGDVAYLDSNRIQLDFSAPFAGKVFIN